MKTSTKFCRGAAAVAIAAGLLTTSAQSAPKKPEPSPAPEQQPATKAKGKTKSKPDTADSVKADAVKTAQKTPPPAAEKKAAPVTKKKKEDTPASPNEKVAKTKVDSKPAPAPEPAPEKKGFFKRLFGSRKSTEEQSGEPNLAKVKTAKPAPVKEVKPVKPAPAVAAAPAPVEEPKKKRGFFSFLRGDGASPGNNDPASSKVPDSEKIVRPADWKEHRVVKEEGLGLYEFGPSQSNGPDARLDTGTVVKIKRIEKGWALVQTNSGKTGYVDAAALRNAVEGDFASPVVRAVATASVSPESWAPAAPPPDLPDHPGALDTESGLLLLPPLEAGPKKQ